MGRTLEKQIHLDQIQSKHNLVFFKLKKKKTF